LVAEEVLEDSTVAITVILIEPIENLWWDLKKGVAACKPKNITELEAIAYEEGAKQKHCQKHTI